MSEGLRLSKSKLLHYRWCPRFFYIKYFTIYGMRSEEQKPEYVYFGSLLHEYFEVYNKNAEDIDYLEEYLEKDKEIKRHIDNFKKLHEIYGLGRPVYAEIKEYDEELDLVGIVDAIYEKNGEYWLIDYKTGRFNKNKMNDYLFELYLYVILIERKLNIKISKVGMFFTNNIYDSFLRRVDEKTKEKVLKEYFSLKKKILDGNFERNRSHSCRYCEFVVICDEYRDEVIKE